MMIVQRPNQYLNAGVISLPAYPEVLTPCAAVFLQPPLACETAVCVKAFVAAADLVYLHMFDLSGPALHVECTCLHAPGRGNEWP